MSYDLNFWKYKKGIYLDNQKVYEKLCNGDLIDELEFLPISQIKKEHFNYLQQNNL